MRILVTGWFSFKDMGATAGDFIAKDMVCNWLKEANVSYDVALSDSSHLHEGVQWQKVDPLTYTDIVFVCGPFGNGWPITDFLALFSHARIIGVNLSLLQPLNEWNPFTLLYERDSSVTSRPDLSFFGPPPTVPVVGVILAHSQLEYGSRALHDKANSAITQLVNSLEVAVVPIDTALQNNSGGLTTAGEVESLIAKMDVVVTTRLHGTVLALKNGVPVIPIDPIAGGAKITKQVKTVGWPILFNADMLRLEDLLLAFEFCKTAAAREAARACAQKAKERLEDTRQKFLTEIEDLRMKQQLLHG